MMRTDVKVGLVCVFAVVVAVVGYFALRSNKTKQVITTPSSEITASETPTGGSNLQLSIPTTSPSTGPTTSMSTSLADSSTSGTSLLGGGPTTNSGLSTPVISAPSTGPSMGSLSSSPMLVPPGSSSSGLSGSSLLPTPALSGGAGPAGSKSSGTIGFDHESSTGGITPYGGSSSGTLGGSKSSSGSLGSGFGSGSSSSLGGGSSLGGSSLGGSSLSLGSGSDKTYSIQKGDTLAVIAKHNGTTVKAIEAANVGVNPNRLKVGQKITLPAASVSSGSSSPSSGATLSLGGSDTDLKPVTSRPASSKRPATTHTAKKAVTTAKAKVKAAAGKLKSVAASTYKVKKGDTLRKIARAVYGDESLWRRIFRANRGDMANANDLTPGQMIHLPSTK